MAKIHIKKAFTMSHDEVREGIEKLGQAMQQEQGMKYQWSGDDKVLFEHKAAKGFIQINSDSVELELKVSFLYSAMAPVMRNKIEEVANRYIT